LFHKTAEINRTERISCAKLSSKITNILCACGSVWGTSNKEEDISVVYPTFRKDFYFYGYCVAMYSRII
jgi:hypothetical protein